jgi:hypothetical protein
MSETTTQSSTFDPTNTLDYLEILNRKWGNLDVGTDTPDYNMCSDCSVIMTQRLGGLECPTCGRCLTVTGDNIKESLDYIDSYVKINRKGRIYSSVTDYAKMQKKVNLAILTECNEKYKKLSTSSNGTVTIDKIADDILNEAADTCTAIQKLVIDEVDESGNTIKQKKFVKRGNIKRELIAACLYYTCLKNLDGRKRTSIAEFMMLNTQGFSNGEHALRDLSNAGKIPLSTNIDPAPAFATRYLKKLNMYNANRYNFILDLIDYTFENSICISTILSTKVVGCIWLLNIYEGLKLTPTDIMSNCDGLKKNTWNIYFMELFDLTFKGKLLDLFSKYKITRQKTKSD